MTTKEEKKENFQSCVKVLLLLMQIQKRTFSCITVAVPSHRIVTLFSIWKIKNFNYNSIMFVLLLFNILIVNYETFKLNQT
jgi:predicted transcriptional regulator